MTARAVEHHTGYVSKPIVLFWFSRGMAFFRVARLPLACFFFVRAVLAAPWVYDVRRGSQQGAPGGGLPARPRGRVPAELDQLGRFPRASRSAGAVNDGLP